MNKEVQIIELKLDGSVEIHDHPKQKEIYSDEIDKDFIESINRHGIRQMPIITPAEDIDLELIDPAKDNFVIVSGHRRIRTAQKLELPIVLCELRRYGTVFDSEVDHIVSNKQREKKPSEIAAEMTAYKQKLSQIRKELETNGLEALGKFKSMRVAQYVQIDEDGRPFLPFARDLIEEELEIKKKKQQQLDLIFNDEWLEEKTDKIALSSLSKKKKTEAIKDFTDLVEEGRKEVDRKDGLSINKVYNEINRVWKDIDSIINPKPKEKTKKKKNITKKWLKAKDFASKINADSSEEVELGSYDTVDCNTEHIQLVLDNGDAYMVHTNTFLKFLKEQGV